VPHRRIVLPLDFPSLAEARPFAERLGDHVGVFKVGLELFTAEGPAAVRPSGRHNLPVFLDLKLHDIPQTVEGAVAAAAKLGVDYLSVHASGGFEMLRRAAARAERESKGRLKLLAVTVLTSLAEEDLQGMGVQRPLRDQVLHLAHLAWTAGIRGFVCSPLEVGMLRKELGHDAQLFVPGVRPPGDQQQGDQKRVATPASAIADGADFVVVGRPIRDAPDPVAAAKVIAFQLGSALGDGPTLAG
jgi:orotidine-5'-phosphate decarboxylase